MQAGRRRGACTARGCATTWTWCSSVSVFISFLRSSVMLISSTVVMQSRVSSSSMTLGSASSSGCAMVTGADGAERTGTNAPRRTLCPPRGGTCASHAARGLPTPGWPPPGCPHPCRAPECVRLVVCSTVGSLFFFEQTSSRGEAAASGPGPLGPHFTGTPAGANAARCPPPGGQRCPPHAHATASPRSLAGSVQARSRCCATSACCRCAAERARHAHGGYAGGRGAQDERGRRGRARHEHESGPPGTESATTAYRGRARNGAMVPDNHHT